MTEDITLIAGVAIAVGVVGTIVPVIPGPLLIAVAVVVWAVVVQTSGAWLLVAVVIALLAAGQLLKYLTAGRTLLAAGVPRLSLLVAGILGIVGFFVLPVIGLVVGFVGGLYLAERQRLGPGPQSWRSTRIALKAVGIGILVELASALVAAVTWLVAVLHGAGGASF
ncbi:MAG: DUF456 domain-containing protein [Actinomycetes bacterium]